MALEQNLERFDSLKHPLHDLRYLTLDKRSPRRSASSKSSPAGKQAYIPPWWRGEDNAFMNAKTAMQGVNALPKMNKG